MVKGNLLGVTVMTDGDIVENWSSKVSSRKKRQYLKIVSLEECPKYAVAR
jgi:hypothetical protein